MRKAKSSEKNGCNKHGGEAIAAGGYGCVFSPVIACNPRKEKKTISPDTGEEQVTKLMFSADAYEEAKEAEKILRVVKKIPGYQKYFLFPTTMCRPDSFTAQDLDNYDQKCSKMANNFPKKYLLDGTALNGISILNMPNGGTDLYRFIKLYGTSSRACAYILAGIGNLLLKAVEPMNKLNICHADLKAENIMINNDGDLRIIDWGLGGIMTESSTGVRATFLNNRPFQYNAPFMLPFVGNFNSFYDNSQPIKNLTSENPSLKAVNIAEVVNSYIDDTLEIDLRALQLPGHLGYFEDRFSLPLLGCCSSRASFRSRAARPTFRQIVQDYIISALSSFTKDRKFRKNEYIKEVFIPNVDVWGTLTTFLHFLDDSVTGVKPAQKEQIVSLIKKYMLSSEYAVKAMPVGEIARTLFKISLDVLDKENGFRGMPQQWQENYAKWITRKQSPLPSPKPAPKKASASQSKATKTKTKKISPKPKASPVRRSPSPKSKSKRTRCPNGTRRNKKTGKCEPK